MGTLSFEAVESICLPNYTLRLCAASRAPSWGRTGRSTSYDSNEWFMLWFTPSISSTSTLSSTSRMVHGVIFLDSEKSRLELGPSWVLVLRNAWEITVEERPLALEMCLHGYGDGCETRLENGSFSPQNGPPRGTTAWYTPY